MDLTFPEQVVIGCYGAIVGVWPIRHLVITILFARLDILTKKSPKYQGAEGEPVPKVTALIPAKDEEETIGACLDSVRAQTYPSLEIMIVDDRSTDRTRAIAEAAAAEDPRISVVSIDHLPEGWTGKTHALQTAQETTSGAWLWFLDADTRHHPDCLSIVMQYARSRQASLASLLPELRCETFWEKAVMPLIGIVLMRTYPTFLTNNPKHRLGFANGQFILIERSTYDEIGGHAAVRDRFVEDIGMAQLVKDAGKSACTAIAPEISSTRMYTSYRSMVRGWSRILYDAHHRKVLPLIGKIIEPLVFSQSGDIAFIVSLIMLAFGWATPFTWSLLGLSTIHQVLKQWVLFRMYRMTAPKDAWYALFYPIAGIVSDIITCRAIWMCLTGQVVWRGTSYQNASALVEGTIAGQPDEIQDSTA